MNFSVTVTDNSKEILEAAQEQVEAALEAVGNQAVSHAKNNIKAAGRIDTGALRNSISHQVEAGEQTVYVGTNQEYAIYNEYGTGIYADGGGRQTPWAYQDAKGEWHMTRGMTGIHFLKNAIADHISEFKNIITGILKGG